MNEELLIKMGLDSSAVATGIRGAKGMVDEFARGVKDSFKEVGVTIAGAFSVGGGALVLEKVLDRMRDIKRVAEDLSISPQFVQDLQNIANARGLPGAGIEKMMGHFVKGLEPGTDPQKAFLDWADAISKVEDPVTRVTMAIEAFGKGGEKMLSVAGEGSKKIKELADSFAKFSDSDIKSLEGSKSTFERFTNWVSVRVGQVLVAAKNQLGVGERIIRNRRGAHGNLFDDILGGGQDAQEDLLGNSRPIDMSLKKAERKEKLLSDSERSADIQDEIDEVWIKILDKQIKRAEEIKAKEHDAYTAFVRAELERQQHDIEALRKAGEHGHELVGNLNAAQMGQVGFTLEELARRRNFSARTAQIFGGSGEMGPPGSAEAQEVLRLRGFAKENAIRGNIGLASTQMNKANDIFDKLARANPFLVDPLDAMKRGIERQAEAAEHLLRRAAVDGIVIIPSMGN